VEGVNGFAAVLAPGQNAIFSITFNAIAPLGGAVSGWVVDYTYGSNSYLPGVLLTANCVAGVPSWNTSPNPYFFGTLKLGQTASQTFTIKNTDTTNSLTVNSIISGYSDFVVSGGPSLPVTLTPGQTTTFDVTCTSSYQGNVSRPKAVVITPSSGEGSVFNLGLSYTGFAITPAYTLTGASQGVLFGLVGRWTSGSDNIVAQSLASLPCEATATLTKMIDFGNPSANTYANRLFMRVDPLGAVTVTSSITSVISEEFTTVSDTKSRAALSTDSLGVPDELIFDLEQNGEIHMVQISVVAGSGILSIQNLIPAFEPRGSVYESA
jgi:hypothetical protein